MKILITLFALLFISTAQAKVTHIADWEDTLDYADGSTSEDENVDCSQDCRGYSLYTDTCTDEEYVTSCTTYGCSDYKKCVSIFE